MTYFRDKIEQNFPPCQTSAYRLNTAQVLIRKQRWGRLPYATRALKCRDVGSEVPDRQNGVTVVHTDARTWYTTATQPLLRKANEGECLQVFRLFLRTKLFFTAVSFKKEIQYLNNTRWKLKPKLPYAVSKHNKLFFVAAPCMLIVLSSLFVQLMHTNYYKIVKQLKSFKIIIVAPTCFGLHKPSSGSSQPVLR